ncbi:MAG: hypothetical protein M0013_02750, partial [Actinomycetota bacterium]|nr:hypothetical protein [Actinomycetota bacterium]
DHTPQRNSSLPRRREDQVFRVAALRARQTGFVDGRRTGPIRGRQTGFVDGRRTGPIRGRQTGFVDGRRTGPIRARQTGFVDGSRTGPIRGRRAVGNRGASSSRIIPRRRRRRHAGQAGCPTTGEPGERLAWSGPEVIVGPGTPEPHLIEEGRDDRSHLRTSP